MKLAIVLILTGIGLFTALNSAHKRTTRNH